MKGAGAPHATTSLARGGGAWAFTRLVLVILTACAALWTAACGVRVGNPRQAGTGTGADRTGDKRDETPPEDPGNDGEAPSKGGVQVPTTESQGASGGATGGGTPRPNGTPDPTRRVVVKLEIEGVVPTPVASLTVRVAAVTFASSQGPVSTVSLPTPVELATLVAGGAPLPAIDVPVGPWTRIALTLDAPVCMGTAQDATPLACRVGAGDEALEFSLGAGGVPFPASDDVTLHLRVPASGVAWDFPGYDAAFPSAAREAGVKIVLPKEGNVASAGP